MPISNVAISPPNLPTGESEHLEQIVPRSSGTSERTSRQNAQLNSLRSSTDASFGSERTTGEKNADWLTWRPAVSAVFTIIGLWTVWVLFASGQRQIETRTAMQLPEPRIGQHATISTAPHFTHIREIVLLAIMNHEQDDDPVKADRFYLSSVSNDATPDRRAYYKNDEFEMYLITSGDPDDLKTVSLVMSLTAFVGEVDGKPTGDGADAFGRCVQRMTAAADPEWVPQLYKWMNENLMTAFTQPESVTLSHKRLQAYLCIFSLYGEEPTVSMLIDAPDRSTSQPE